MRLMRSIIPLLLVALAPMLARAQTSGGARASAAAEAPTRVILFIGDGVGTAYWTAARFEADSLAVRRLPVVGLVDTRSASDWITDSAAGATTYATGVRTYNGAIGVDADSAAVPTVLERAEGRGLATGLVATSSITHATPASFAAHVANRSMQPEIASQMAEQGIEVLLGGGLGYFDGTLRPDSQDLLPALRDDYAVVTEAAELRALESDTLTALLGLFAEDGMVPAAEREPTLAEMTAASLDVLDRNPAGFFLMVEGSQPDWRGHANAPLGAVVDEMLDLDRAIGTALEYQTRNPETLIVVTADHETGGLALATDSTGALVADYTSDYHTPAMVPLFAGGPGADRFGGILPNTRIGELLIERIAEPAAAAVGSGGPR